MLPATFDPKQNTIDLVWSTGARVRRQSWFDDPWDEELSMAPEAVRLGRLNKGASVLNAHDTWEGLNSVIGAVVPGSARLADGAEHGLPGVTVGVATVRLSQRPELAGLVGDIRDGIIRHVSIGYDIHRWAITRGKDREDGETLDLYRAEDWEPFEISYVPVPADPDAQSRSRTGSRRGKPMTKKRGGGPVDFPKAEGAVFAAGGHVYWNGEAATMNPEDTHLGMAAAEALADADTVSVTVGGEAPAAEEAPATGAAAADPAQAGRAAIEKAERTRIALIQARGKKLGAKPEVVQGLVDSGTDLETATRKLFDSVATQQEQNVTHPHTPTMPGDTDHRRMRGEAMARSLLHRYDGRRYNLDDDARAYRGMTLVRLAEQYLRDEGIDVRGLSPHQIAQRALKHRSSMHTTSDFPLILADVATKSLRDAYTEAPRTYEPFVRMTTLPDFKETSRVQLGESPSFSLVPEGGEYKTVTIGEGREKYRLHKHGAIFPITFETLVNDDLGAFTRIPGLFGRSGANKEMDEVWGIITGNPAMADGQNLFSLAHANIGDAAALSATAVATLRAGMRLQKGIDGKTLLNIVPRHILLPVALEGKWARVSGPKMVPTKADDVTPDFVAGLNPIVEPRLDASSATAYYLAADPSDIDTIELAHLAGSEGVETETRDGFDVDGVEIKARLILGVKAIDHRGFAKNAGQ